MSLLWPLLSGLAVALLAFFLLQKNACRQRRRASQEDVLDGRIRQLREAMAQAEAAGQAKTAFLSIISHELRTPLHTILGYTQLLQRQLSGEARQKLSVIANSSAQLLSLIDDVLDFSRGEAFSVDLQLDAVALAPLVSQWTDSSRLLAGRRGNRFEVELADGLPPAIEADERRLTQILQNLIGNACKYTENGLIRLVIRPEATEGEWHRLRFSVEDTGPGIPFDEQAHIFEPFTRVSGHQKQPGVGLGLAIARQLAIAMGGHISVDSTPGSGSRFHVVLPLRAVEIPEEGGTPDAASIIGYQGRRLTLLVADDIPENRALLSEMFGRLGFSMRTANDGEEALNICLSADPPIDAALVDQFMPRRDGWGLLAALRAEPRLAHLPVILISAAMPRRPAHLAAEIDFDHKLMKPLCLDHLAAILQQALGFEWVRAPAPQARSPDAPLSLPGAAEMKDFHDLLALGKVIALQRWAHTLAEEKPQYAPFAGRVVELARAIDLPGLKQLGQETPKASV